MLPLSSRQLVALALALAGGAVSIACASAEDETNVAPDEIVTNNGDVISLSASDYAKKSAAEKQRVLWKWLSDTEYCAGAKTGDDGTSASTAWPTAQAGSVDLSKLMFRDPAARTGLLFDSKSKNAGDYVACGAAKLQPEGTSGFGLLSAKSFLRRAFDNDAKHGNPDVRPENRGLKIFHPYGSVAAVAVVMNHNAGNPGYTGMLAPGRTSLGIARLSPAGGDRLIPGVAIKFLVDGGRSVNTHMITGLVGQDSKNWFDEPVQNFLSDPRNASAPLHGPDRRRLLGIANDLLALAAPKKDTLQIPVDHLTRVNPDGTRPEQPVYPFNLVFSPHPKVRDAMAPIASDAGDPTKEFAIALRAIPAGTPIYQIQAQRPCTDETGSLQQQIIGEVVTLSPIIATTNGDFQLHFEHNSGTRCDERGTGISNTNVKDLDCSGPGASKVTFEEPEGVCAK